MFISLYIFTINVIGNKLYKINTIVDAPHKVMIKSLLF